MRRSHKIPREKITVTATFFLIGSCNFHITGKGSSKIATSVAMFGMEFLRMNPEAPMQCPLCFVESQSNLAGVQLRTLTSTAAIHHAVMTPIRIYVVMRS